MQKISLHNFMLQIFVMAFLSIPFSSMGTGKPVQSGDGKEILTPAPGAVPRINGPQVYGCRPGHPFLYRIPCQGERPITFSAKGLPKGLQLDPVTGIIKGTTPAKGEYLVVIQAVNAKGKSKRAFKIIAGDKLALTPPMGWNHWYVHYNRINDQLMREAADAMVSSGMADVGYQYINIDDCWMNAAAATKYMQDSSRVGPIRNNNGNILPNRHFPDMKGLTDYIHSKGLKAGIYTSPGVSTCCGLTGAWQHEEQDAAQFAAWGFDFLKYDWCSYGRIAGKEPTLAEMQKPYILMGDALHRQPRDMVYNLCQYGMGDVWEWGEKVGGHCWRTAGDLGFELDRFFNVALKNAEHAAWSRPGAWNDPDYLQIGYIGSQKNETFTLPIPCPLTGNEQYSYMSLWCLMASPLIFSGDMSRLDDFTLNVLCNPEIIEVDQDPLGTCGTVIKKADNCFLMVKVLADGSKAVGLFNHGKQSAEVRATWDELQVSGKQAVRDLWRQKELGIFNQQFSANIPSQGVVMVKIAKK
jgi:alpha-galactosidase